mmetsp:Transcript_8979/g.23142  ORF Transcript_8979/g.23142 Transcript_8979/m.23142 type:complete len:403 (-) Transcript_8979:102-1310(-)
MSFFSRRSLAARAFCASSFASCFFFWRICRLESSILQARRTSGIPKTSAAEVFGLRMPVRRRRSTSAVSFLDHATARHRALAPGDIDPITDFSMKTLITARTVSGFFRCSSRCSVYVVSVDSSTCTMCAAELGFGASCGTLANLSADATKSRGTRAAPLSTSRSVTRLFTSASDAVRNAMVSRTFPPNISSITMMDARSIWAPSWKLRFTSRTFRSSAASSSFFFLICSSRIRFRSGSDLAISSYSFLNFCHMTASNLSSTTTLAVHSRRVIGSVIECDSQLVMHPMQYLWLFAVTTGRYTSSRQIAQVYSWLTLPESVRAGVSSKLGESAPAPSRSAILGAVRIDSLSGFIVCVLRRCATSCWWQRWGGEAVGLLCSRGCHRLQGRGMQGGGRREVYEVTT